MPRDRQTDMTMLIVTFRNSVNGLKWNFFVLSVDVQLDSKWLQ